MDVVYVKKDMVGRDVIVALMATMDIQIADLAIAAQLVHLQWDVTLLENVLVFKTSLEKLVISVVLDIINTQNA